MTQNIFDPDILQSQFIWQLRGTQIHLGISFLADALFSCYTLVVSNKTIKQ